MTVQLHFLNLSSKLQVFNFTFIQDTNSSQTQQFYYIITFKATCFGCIESSSGALEKRSNVSTFIVHSGIPKAYSMWYSQYKSTRARDLIICTVEYLKVKMIKVIHKSSISLKYRQKVQVTRIKYEKSLTRVLLY